MPHPAGEPNGRRLAADGRTPAGSHQHAHGVTERPPATPTPTKHAANRRSPQHPTIAGIRRRPGCPGPPALRMWPRPHVDAARVRAAPGAPVGPCPRSACSLLAMMSSSDARWTTTPWIDLDRPLDHLVVRPPHGDGEVASTSTGPASVIQVELTKLRSVARRRSPARGPPRRSGRPLAGARRAPPRVAPGSRRCCGMTSMSRVWRCRRGPGRRSRPRSGSRRRGRRRPAGCARGRTVSWHVARCGVASGVDLLEVGDQLAGVSSRVPSSRSARRPPSVDPSRRPSQRRRARVPPQLHRPCLQRTAAASAGSSKGAAGRQLTATVAATLSTTSGRRSE